jgi:hypothetical protein
MAEILARLAVDHDLPGGIRGQVDERDGIAAGDGRGRRRLPGAGGPECQGRRDQQQMGDMIPISHLFPGIMTDMIPVGAIGSENK